MPLNHERPWARGELEKALKATTVMRSYFATKTDMLRRRGAWLLLLVGCAFGNNAVAHKVNVFAYLEGDRIYVQGYFPDGKKAMNSKVSVYAGGDQAIIEGVTNDAGEFTFPTPAKQDVRIVLNAGEGHQAEYQFTAAETAGVMADPVSQQEPGVAAADPSARQSGAGDALPRLDNAELRRAVAEGVLPLAREIAELKERRSVSDIIGGVGFIVGVLGAFAYFQARKRR